ncbi:MAG: hypothetical protein CMQ43_03915 [Gammaproteobacteria bacterium]|nr:hypothetical protein [Gammaproteobacteria bacterium]
MAEPQDEQPLPAETVEPPDAPEAAAAAGTDALLDLTAEVVTAATPEARRAIERDLAEAFEAAPSHDNLLRLSLVRALTAALPAELESVRADLEVLANGREELTDGQRHLALLTLVLVEDRLTLGRQITELRNQIESLTEIEASLNPPPAERTP